MVKPRTTAQEAASVTESLDLLEAAEDSSAGDRDDPSPDGSDGPRLTDSLPSDRGPASEIPGANPGSENQSRDESS